MRSIYDILANPKYAHFWSTPGGYIHPALVKEGFTPDSFPITDLRVSMLRMELEGIEFPDEFYDSNTGELQIVTGGGIPTIGVHNYKGFDCVKLKHTPDHGDSYTLRYLLFCPKGTNGAGKDYGDDGTWHGERTREDDARDKANQAWLEWVGNPGG